MFRHAAQEPLLLQGLSRPWVEREDDWDLVGDLGEPFEDRPQAGRVVGVLGAVDGPQNVALGYEPEAIQDAASRSARSP